MRPNPDYQIDFARPLLAWTLLRWPGVVIVLVLLILTMKLHVDNTNQYEAIETLKQRQQTLAQQRVQKKKNQTALVEQGRSTQKIHVMQVSEQQSAKEMIRQVNLRWFELLGALESSQVPEIALLQLTPDPNRGVFLLSGEAKSYTDLLVYVGYLQGLPVLHQVHLQKHQVNESHPQRPVSFEIEGGWQP